MFWRDSLWQHEETKTVRLHTNNKKMPHVAQVVKLQWTQNETPISLVIANVHLSAKFYDTATQLCQLQKTLGVLDDLQTDPHAAALLCGDFNSLPDSEVYNTVKTSSLGSGNAFHSTFHTKHGAEPSYTNLFYDYPNDPSEKGTLDYVFARNCHQGTSLVHTVDEAHVFPIQQQNFMSDHCPLLVTLRSGMTPMPPPVQNSPAYRVTDPRPTLKTKPRGNHGAYEKPELKLTKPEGKGKGNDEVYCYWFNNPQGCKDPQTCKYIHICGRCKRKGHGGHACRYYGRQ
jgi:exonuclease III